MRQNATLNNDVIRATTYSLPGYYGHTRNNGYVDAEYDALGRLVSEFVEDWYSVR